MRWRRRWRDPLLVAVMVMWLAPAAGAATWAQSQPRPAGHVNDFAGVMRPEAVQQLESALIELEHVTGAEMAVATVPTVPDGNIEQAAVDLFHQWGVGKQRADNGVLLLCAVQDRKVRIEVGYGLEPVLPDAVCGRIIREQMVPFFRAGDFSGGLMNGGMAVAQLIAQHAGVTLAGAVVAPLSRSMPWWLQLLFFGGCLLLVTLLRRMQRSFGSMFWGDYFGSSVGGFGGGGFGGGGFGGFGGGSSGGGGASGSW